MLTRRTLRAVFTMRRHRRRPGRSRRRLLDKRTEERAMENPDTREWLTTNGLGGYASGTICGANTRRYHGLLVAALEPPGRRTVLLSRLDETVIVGGEVYELGANFWISGSVAPQGHHHLKSFQAS